MRLVTRYTLLCALSVGCSDDDQSIATRTTTTPSSSTVTGSATALTSATTATMTTATTDASTGDGTGCNHVCFPDHYIPPECSLFEQDCDEGFKCAAYDWNGNGFLDNLKCVEIMGDGQHNEPCTSSGPETGEDTCAKGLACWYVDENGDGVCVAQCSGTAENPACEPPKTYCALSSSVLTLCLPGCDPLLQECDEDERCLPTVNGPFRCWDGVPLGTAPAGAPCEVAPDCETGLYCTDPVAFPGTGCVDAQGCCTPFCDLNAIDPCADLEGVLQMAQTAHCVPWFEDQAPSGWEHLGTCAVL